MSERTAFRYESNIFEAFEEVFEKFNINPTKTEKIYWIDRYKERFLHYKEKKVGCECANKLQSKNTIFTVNRQKSNYMWFIF